MPSALFRSRYQSSVPIRKFSAHNRFSGAFGYRLGHLYLPTKHAHIRIPPGVVYRAFVCGDSGGWQFVLDRWVILDLRNVEGFLAASLLHFSFFPSTRRGGLFGEDCSLWAETRLFRITIRRSDRLKITPDHLTLTERDRFRFKHRFGHLAELLKSFTEITSRLLLLSLRRL